jgi:RNA polymerase subunit RPABC4/transcription elongation factor Spt4
MSEKKQNSIPCRYCKYDIDKGMKRCPHCGTLNPSMGVKQSLIWTVSAIVILYLLSFLIHTMKG